MADEGEKILAAVGSGGQVAEAAEHDPASDRIFESQMPVGAVIPFDPELYEPPLSPEEYEALLDEDRNYLVLVGTLHFVGP
jgi:hypothetical protein